MTVRIICDGGCGKPIAHGDQFAGVAAGSYAKPRRSGEQWWLVRAGKSWLSEVCESCFASYAAEWERQWREGNKRPESWSCARCEAPIPGPHVEVYVEAFMRCRQRLYSDAWTDRSNRLTGIQCAVFFFCLDCIDQTAFREPAR